ncbi:transcription initiation factor IIB [Haloplanus natans]|uniref:transcription initiation factor IIB n=1 Tax=Haloplanus natans TaxID=376171 RepID=UPI000A01D8C2|nr:transcription initiation factor IIB family protein [Haloplanus natans]
MSLNSPSYATVSTDQCTDSRHHVDADETPANASGCCPECDGVQLVSDDTETYCPDCGLLVEDAGLDHGPEWTPYDEAERRRVGGPVTPIRHDRGISAEIGRFRDGHGRELPAATRARLRRLRRWDRRARFESKADQNLAHGLGEIRRIGGALGVGESIQAEAGQLFREAQSADLIRGRSLESLASAAVYAACRRRRLPRFLDEVAEAARVDHGKVRLAYGVLNRELSLRIPPAVPADFLPRLASAVDASERVRERAAQLCDSDVLIDLANGRKPAGVAAGCLYFAGRELKGFGAVTQEQLATAARISEVSLQHVWQALQDRELPVWSAESSDSSTKIERELP